MSHSYTVGPARDDSEFEALMAILRLVFSFPPERGERYADRLGHENFRVIRAGEEPVGGLALIRMGQFFGGRSVPSVGISVVGIAPHFRGQGAGRCLMRQTVEDLHRAGATLSALYPATQPIYRSAGYEQAGGRWETTLPLNDINISDHELQMRPLTEQDAETVAKLYRDDVMRHHGPLDRNEFIWWRVREPRGDIAHGQLIHADGEPQGYIYCVQRPNEGFPPHHLAISDLAARTPRAGRRILTFLSEHRSMADRAIFYRLPVDPLLCLLPEQSARTRLEITWMLRIVNAEAALTARGYAPELAAELHFNVHDDLIEPNNGPFILRISDGQGEVTRGGAGRLDIDIRGLAMFYSGFSSATNLLATGLLRGSAEDACGADAVFAGPMPWMTDIF
jgi:predicted acetyltransferase